MSVSSLQLHPYNIKFIASIRNHCWRGTAVILQQWKQTVVAVMRWEPSCTEYVFYVVETALQRNKWNGSICQWNKIISKHIWTLDLKQSVKLDFTPSAIIVSSAIRFFQTIMKQYDIQMYKMFEACGPGLPPTQNRRRSNRKWETWIWFLVRGTQIVPSAREGRGVCANSANT